MYNRYSPQPDGTYKRRTVNSHVNIQPTASPCPEEHCEVSSHENDTAKCIPSERSKPQNIRKQRQSIRYKQEKSAASFLRDLLPRDLDTGDLLIVILLLLMSADCSGEDQANALLTLALYLFM